MGSQRFLLRLHRWVSLAVCAFWLAQAATGLAIMFHWELEDAGVPGAHRPTDLARLGALVDGVAASEPGRRVVSVWTTAGAPDRYDVTVKDASGKRYAMRVAGDGALLRLADKDEHGMLDRLVSWHQSMLGGDLGRTLVGISGLILASNIIAGVYMAWPRNGAWRRALIPGPARGVPGLFAWHRAIGLWLAAPALVLTAAGVLLAFEDPFRHATHAESIQIPAVQGSGATIPFAAAVAAAEAALPGSKLTAVQMPTAKDATFRVRLLAPGELRRAYGVSLVFVNANTGAVRAVVPASRQGLARQIIDGAYAVHTGEAASWPGRVLNIATAISLIAAIVAGLLLWRRRSVIQRDRARSRAQADAAR